MRHEIIKVDNYLLVLNDSIPELDKGEYFLFIGARHPSKWMGEGKRPLTEFSSKIIAHLPLNGLPILEGVPLLPPIEDDVLELAEYYWKMQYIHLFALDESTKPYIIEDFKAGYNKAKEKFRYTEKDMRKAIAFGGTKVAMKESLNSSDAEDFIQSIHQYPTEFECEMVDFEVDMGIGEECVEYGKYPKTITTTQGIQWVGKYLIQTEHH